MHRRSNCAGRIYACRSSHKRALVLDASTRVAAAAQEAASSICALQNTRTVDALEPPPLRRRSSPGPTRDA